jgi:hypothetical protein
MTEVVEYPTCFACARTYSRGDGRFCSSVCRNAYDDGYPARKSSPRLPAINGKRIWGPISNPHLATLNLKQRSDGFEIECRGCQKAFISKGLRCCSDKCDRQYVARQDNLALMASVGMEPFAKRQCEGCGKPLPRYVGEGKKRRVSTRVTCSEKCQKKRRMALDSRDAVLTREA